MMYSTFNRIKKVIIILCIMLLYTGIPLFSQSNTITIDKTKLEQLIQSEVQKAIDKAVNDAVTIAVKDTEKKYTDIIAARDIVIAQNTGQIEKDKVDYTALYSEFSQYKKNNGVIQYLEVGLVSLAGGILVDEIVHIFVHF